MAELDLSSELAELEEVLASVLAVTRPDEVAAEIASLEVEAANPDIWNDQETAQRVTSQLSRLKSKKQKLDDVAARLDDLKVLIEMANAEDDSETKLEARGELKAIANLIDSLEVETLLNGEYDARGAIVTIRSGAGGDDATDFAEMLMRMYLRYCEKQSYKTTVLDISYAEGLASRARYLKSTLHLPTGSYRSSPAPTAWCA